jgi:hypothetical protein
VAAAVGGDEKIIEHYTIGHSPPPPGNVTGRELLSRTMLYGTVDYQ